MYIISLYLLIITAVVCQHSTLNTDAFYAIVQSSYILHCWKKCMLVKKKH